MIRVCHSRFQPFRPRKSHDGGRLTSNWGVMLLAMAERRLGLAESLAGVFPDRRDGRALVATFKGRPRPKTIAVSDHVARPHSKKLPPSGQFAPRVIPLSRAARDRFEDYRAGWMAISAVSMGANNNGW
jgi:hypothetical protein